MSYNTDAEESDSSMNSGCSSGGVVEVSRSGTVKGKMTTESLSAVAWLQDFCNSYAEKLPNESKLNLPPCLTKQYVYGLYLEKATNPRSRFSKCDKCTLIKEHLATCREKHQRETLIKMREKHLKQQKLSDSNVVTAQFTNTSKARCYFNRDDYKLFQMNEAIISGSDDPHGIRCTIEPESSGFSGMSSVDYGA
uniref:Uncharacterized protein n=1 Tax=Magallana gigas TaxID=29159 RepID=K1QJF1_MAGGI